MLTDPLLRELVDTKKLVPWFPPSSIPIRVVRTLLVAPIAHELLVRDPWPRDAEDRSDRDARERRRSMHALLNNFVGGMRLTPNVDIKVLEPISPEFADLAEFRSGPPRPQSRLFAQVYQRGVWVALGFRLRSDLGDRGDPRWSEAAQECKANWSASIGRKSPHRLRYPCNSFKDLRFYSDD